MADPQAPEGWYDDGSGRQRWWDGAKWTDQYADQPQAASVPLPPRISPVAASSAPSPHKPIPKTLWIALASVIGAVVIAVVITVVLIGNAVPKTPLAYLTGTWDCSGSEDVIGSPVSAFTATFDGKTLTFSGDQVPGVHSPTLGEGANGAVVSHLNGNFVTLDTGWTLRFPESLPLDGTSVEVPFVQFGDGSEPSAEVLSSLDQGASNSYLTATKQGNTFHLTWTNLDNNAAGDTAVWDLGQCFKA